MLEEPHYCMRSIFYVPEEMHHCMCSIFHVPEEIHHHICPILTYARRIALLHALDILCARRNAPLHMLDTACARYYIMPEEVHHCIVLDIACARRNALSHCARDFIVPEVCISSRLHRARILHVPESNQVTRVSIDVKNRYALFTHYLYPKGVILHRRHLSWPADFMSWPEDLFYAYHVPKALWSKGIIFIACGHHIIA